ncbi:MAG: SDR family oxidoreductase [Gammaproteobacteria bacterium]|nr:SDR family oxidoreductase [Gammaproteobacteria bacterium]MCI0591461.1 SDR family oxidoreductase [Gammaproteobacteria bacterium]
MSLTDLTNRRVVVTGVGFRKPADTSNPSNVFITPDVKPNIGAAVALEAARAGYAVVIVARTASKLERVRASILEVVPTAEIMSYPVDLLDLRSVQNLASTLASGREIDLVHSAGLSAGTYKLPNDNPYLAIDQTPGDLPVVEFEAVVRSLLFVIQAFLPRLREQIRSRIVVVSSMSGIRAVPFGFAHVSAKGGLRQAVRSLTLELNPLGIQVSEVLPGIVNTGMYDSPAVDEAIRRMGHSFGYSYEPGKLPQMTATAVSEAVILCLSSDAHILSIPMVASGQFPHHGA